MASKYFFVCVAVLVVLCLVLTSTEPSDCNSKFGCLYANVSVTGSQNRKVLAAALVTKNAGEKAILYESSNGMSGKKSLNWELRKVPSGPDPLHHNGGSPKKPRTP